MADENLRDEAEGLESSATEVVEEAAEQVEAADEQVVEDAAETVDAPVDGAQELDEMVETAVENVAKEAEAEVAEAASSEQVADAAPAKKRERRSKQARAEKAARSSASEPAAAAAPAKAGGFGLPVLIAAAVGCLALGMVLGRFVLGGGAASGGQLGGKTTVTEAELDNAYATYTYGGETSTVTVREVIEQNGPVENAKDAEGNYTLPAAENVLNVARTAILNKEIESRGITVTEDEIASYAETSLGTSDYDAIASTYGMETDAVKKLIEENCRLSKLREEVVEGELPEMPEAPATAEEGKEEEATEAYAEYILGLAGDQWDAKKGAWADESSSYATALADYEFDGKTANYNAAQAAYYVAYQEYTTKSQEISTQWTEFLNSLLSNASIQINSMVS